jgi:hypothetical protein
MGGPVQTLDDMLALNLLTPDQHSEIHAWTTRAKSPERIMQMPPHLWRALEMASLLMDFDADLAPPH